MTKLLYALQHGHRGRRSNKQTVVRAIVQLQSFSNDDRGNYDARCHRPMLQIARSASSSKTSIARQAIPSLASDPTSSSYSILSKEAATAPIDYPTSSRIWALPPAIAIHLSIGSVYVYSMWTPAMSKALGASYLDNILLLAMYIPALCSYLIHNL